MRQMRLLPARYAFILHDRRVNPGQPDRRYSGGACVSPTPTPAYPIPNRLDEEALVMLSGILPTGFECGVLNGKVEPGSTVAIVGADPIGLASL